MDNNMYENGEGQQQNGTFTGMEPEPGFQEGYERREKYEGQSPEYGYEYGQPGGHPYEGQGYQYPQQGGYQPELEEPVSLGEWLIALLLITFVPCVNIVLMFVWAFSKKEKKSKSNFFKAQLIISGVMLVLYIIIALFAVMLFAMGEVPYYY
ncbi:hypothetical protein [Kineothrix sp. MB12-C1]|uniref:hypothetical protein n=1 Tax=Kineothrix sp. MB12-C1 TaxID=3070215 RepID=UPI0027D33860|nr:hypothetical protein [Kineothrix sp. MB12-C1]WMC93832.1 hypothetical protein RBB56_06110 [Kineothrix sp. MB12-C1]